MYVCVCLRVCINLPTLFPSCSPSAKPNLEIISFDVLICEIVGIIGTLKHSYVLMISDAWSDFSVWFDSSVHSAFLLGLVVSPFTPYCC